MSASGRKTGRGDLREERKQMRQGGQRIEGSARRMLLALVATVACAAISGIATGLSSAATPEENFAFGPTSAALSTPEAGRHADFETRFEFNGDLTEPLPYPGGFQPYARMRDVSVQLPPGLIGNPSAFPVCPDDVFLRQGDFQHSTISCPTDSQVGILAPGLAGSFPVPPGALHEPLYNLQAPGGDSHIVARLGFVALIYPMFIDVKVDPMRDNALTATLVNPPTLAPVTGAYTTLWGVPTDHSHDLERFTWFEVLGQPEPNPVPSGLEPTPFMSNPTSCGPTELGFAADTYERYHDYDFSRAPLADITDCASVPFEPTMSLKPTTRSPSSSSGLDVDLQIPQQGLLEPNGAASAHLKTAKVTLPQGVTLNASAADGLGSCSEEQIGLHRNERQIVDFGRNAAPVVLSLDGQSTSPLPQKAGAAAVGAALEALPNVGAGDVVVTGRPGGPWNVEFVGPLAGKDVSPIGGTHSELQQLGVKGTGGTYKLAFGGAETAPLPLEAAAAEVQAALAGLPGIGAGGVVVEGGRTRAPGAQVSSHGGPTFRIAFVGAHVGADMPQIGIASELEGGETLAEVVTLTQGGSDVMTHTAQEGGSVRFDESDPRCPESSKIASGKIVTPVLSGDLEASLYLAKQSDNPFRSLFAAYLVAEGQGVTLKTSAEIDIDPSTGQIVTTFVDNPQQPFSDLTLSFKGGNRGLLTTPDHCGTYVTQYELTPWSGQPPAVGTSEFTLDENCGPRGFAPGFHAGSSNPLAGSYASFITEVTRNSGAPGLTGVSVTMPPGLTAKLAGIPYCSDAALAAVATGPGNGAGQVASPSCPTASEVGKVVAGTGSGTPLYVNTGKVYLAGPYKGAPLSLAVVTPALAGPFDLGNVVVRVAVNLDPVTAQVHAASDPIPTTLQGVPLDVRDLRVSLNKPTFALNPTDCSEEAATGRIEGAGGITADVSDRFQVGECAALGFKPKMSLRFDGGTVRTKHPALTVVLQPRPGDANISSVSVRFPATELLDQSHLRTICTRVQFAADDCPANSIYGTVTATTPLLDQPLKGNVYLRSSNHTLPDLVLDLRGPANQPIHLEASGRNDSVHRGLRNSFEFVPDAPLTRVVLKMRGGKKGLLQNSTNICARKNTIQVRYTAHNGRAYEAHPKLQVSGCRGGKHKHKGNKGKRRG
jgi:hypothetical protein